MSDRASIVLCLPAGTPLFDPDPAITGSRAVELVTEWDDDTIGIVGWSTGGWEGLRLAVEHPALPRLAVLSTPFPDDASHGVDLDSVLAKTLLLYGSRDGLTGSKHGTAWQKRLPNARLEMVPGGNHDLLVPMWSRVLSHLAPRRRR